MHQNYWQGRVCTGSTCAAVAAAVACWTASLSFVTYCTRSRQLCETVPQREAAHDATRALDAGQRNAQRTSAMRNRASTRPFIHRAGCSDLKKKKGTHKIFDPAGSTLGTGRMCAYMHGRCGGNSLANAARATEQRSYRARMCMRSRERTEVLLGQVT